GCFHPGSYVSERGAGARCHPTKPTEPTGARKREGLTTSRGDEPEGKLVVEIETVRNEGHRKEQPRFRPSPTEQGEQRDAAHTEHARAMRGRVAHPPQPLNRPVWRDDNRSQDEKPAKKNRLKTGTPSKKRQPDVRLHDGQSSRRRNQRERQNKKTRL